MPVKWTAELDAILLNGVFEQCNISFSQALCDYIARRVQATGIECTPKAVKNRLYMWKQKNVAGGGLNTNTSSTPMKSIATPPKTPKTPASRNKAASKKNVKKTASGSEDDDHEAPDNDLLGSRESPVSPSTGRGKRARTASYAESDSEDAPMYVPMGKRIKTEPKEDEEFEGFEGEGDELEV